jgi:hypothetical protein
MDGNHHPHCRTALYGHIGNGKQHEAVFGSIPLPTSEPVAGAFKTLPHPLQNPDQHQINITDILTERGKEYGLFKDHAVITQHIKDIMRTSPSSNWFLKLDEDQREALEMIAHKIGRILNGNPNNVDSWADIAGYAKLVADRLQGTVR